MQDYKFEDEKGRIREIRRKALEKYPELEMPESIRTPGRTWTRYPDLEDEIPEISDTDPEIIVDGDAAFWTGVDAAEEAGEKLLNSIKPEENKLNALHSAYINSLIYVKVDGEADVKIKHESNQPLFSHLVVETGDNTDVKVKEEFRGNDVSVQTSFTEIYTGKNSHVNYGAVESLDAELSYSRRKAIVNKDSSINWLNSQFESDLNRTQIDTVLKGDNSRTEKIAVWYPIDEQHIDISLKAFHQGTNTKCDMDSRAVVDNQARSLYEGLQQVEQQAEDTSSFQDQETLMLSDNAESDASPKLMIENPDVEASHAAAAGNIPKKEQHYLESRGLTQEQAERLVVKGYFEPVMQKITLPRLKETVRKEVQRKLEKTQ